MKLYLDNYGELGEINTSEYLIYLINKLFLIDLNFNYILTQYKF